MRQWFRHMSLRSVVRFKRGLVAYIVVPAILLSSFATQAILIHDHDGHETHGHALTVPELNEWRGNSEHRRENHEHDDRPADPTENDDQPIVIGLNLPMALPGVRGLSNGVAVRNTTKLFDVVPWNDSRQSS